MRPGGGAAQIEFAIAESADLKVASHRERSSGHGINANAVDIGGAERATNPIVSAGQSDGTAGLHDMALSGGGCRLIAADIELGRPESAGADVHDSFAGIADGNRPEEGVAGAGQIVNAVARLTDPSQRGGVGEIATTLVEGSGLRRADAGQSEGRCCAASFSQVTTGHVDDALRAVASNRQPVIDVQRAAAQVQSASRARSASAIANPEFTVRRIAAGVENHGRGRARSKVSATTKFCSAGGRHCAAVIGEKTCAPFGNVQFQSRRQSPAANRKISRRSRHLGGAEPSVDRHGSGSLVVSVVRCA